MLTLRQSAAPHDGWFFEFCREPVIPRSGDRASAPDCRLAVATHRSPIKHSFNSAACPVGGFSFILPNRLYAFKHKSRINIGNWQLADLGKDVGLQRVQKLLPVFHVFPTGLVIFVIRFRCRLEGDGASRF
jgi:hypothetical protein